MSIPYVHGHHDAEALRLFAQARTLGDLLHRGTTFPAGSRVLEAGCGAGAQVLALARRSPGEAIMAVDTAASAVRRTRNAVVDAGLTQVTVRQADILDLPASGERFDHAFACFVLEHLAAPEQALAALRTVLEPGGTLTAIEGDHGSILFHPDAPDARHAIACQVALQARAGGNARVGRRLGSLTRRAGFADVIVAPRTVYPDAGRPDLVQGFTLDNFTAMVAGVRDEAVEAGLTTAPRFTAGLDALRRARRQFRLHLLQDDRPRSWSLRATRPRQAGASGPWHRARA